jgi:hypothetical protein
MFASRCFEPRYRPVLPYLREARVISGDRASDGVAVPVMAPLMGEP